MNKKWIKIIDFLNMIHSGEKPPEKIIISGHRYRYNEKTKDYDSDIGFDNKDLFLHIGILKELDTEIGILEDNTEDIEEYKGETFEQLGYEVGKLSIAIAKGFEKAIKESRKEK